MLYGKLITVILVAIVLLGSGCSTHKVAHTSAERKVERTTMRDSARMEQVAVRDTLKEVTTVTVLLREGEGVGGSPDTIARNVVTERYRGHDATRLQKERVEHRVDTVFVERRDSVVVKEPRGSARTPGTTIAFLIGILLVVFLLKVKVR